MRPPPREVALYRAALRDVNTLAQRDLLTFWRRFDLTDAVRVRDGLMDVLPGIIDGYHLSAATVAADWYDIQRLEAQVGKRFQAVMADVPTKERSQVLARWSVGPYFVDQAPEVAAPLALSKVSGAVQRLIADGARRTIIESAARDPKRVGWARETDGDSCEFCQMLAGRGAVYTSASADFESHDKCGCVGVPEF